MCGQLQQSNSNWHFGPALKILRSQTSSVEEPSPLSLIHWDYFDPGKYCKKLAAFVNWSEIQHRNVSRSINHLYLLIHILQFYQFLKCTWIKYSEFEFQIVRTWRLTCWGRAQPFCNIILLLTSLRFWQELFKQNTMIHNFLS